MTIREHLSALTEVLPADASVVLTAATIRQWLEEDISPLVSKPGSIAIDSTVAEVAALLKRK